MKRPLQELTNGVKVAWEAWQQEKGRQKWNGEMSRKGNVQELMSSWM